MKFSNLQYSRPNFEQIIDELDKAIGKIKNARSGKEQVEIFDQVLRASNDLKTQYALVRIRHLLNTNDEFYRGEQKMFSQKMPLFDLKSNEITRLLVSSNFKEEIETKIGSVALRNYELYNKTISQDIVEEMREESALVIEYVGIISKLSVDFDGKTMPLAMLAPYKESTDREVRKRAFIAEGEVYSSVKDKLDDIFDKLVKNRTTQAKKLGFDNYVELGYAEMGRNCYTCEDIAVFKNQVLQSVVPVTEEIFANRKNRLGIDDMFFYDMLLTFKDGAPKPQISVEDIIENGRKLYHEMSDVTAEFIDVMIDNELIDVYSKLGKSPGGFCSYLKNYNYPFIFANFNGTSSDIYVFTHEMGHALSRYLKGKKNEIQYAHATMDISEIHSMAMEFLTSPWHELFFKEQTAKYRLSHAENAVNLIPYACQVDEFQEQIYLNPNLSPKERDEKWLEIERKYRPDIKYEDVPFYSIGAGWQRQTHIYKTPFYYIDYALAQVMAIQFFLLFLEDKDKSYKLYFEFLSFGGDKTFVDLIDALNLKSPLKQGTLKPIAQKLLSFINQNNI